MVLVLPEAMQASITTNNFLDAELWYCILILSLSSCFSFLFLVLFSFLFLLLLFLFVFSLISSRLIANLQSCTGLEEELLAALKRFLIHLAKLLLWTGIFYGM